MIKPSYVQKIVPNCECVGLCNFKRSEEKGKLTDALCRRLPESQAVKFAILSAKKPARITTEDGQDFSHVTTIKRKSTGEDFSFVTVLK